MTNKPITPKRAKKAQRGKVEVDSVTRVEVKGCGPQCPMFAQIDDVFLCDRQTGYRHAIDTLFSTCPLKTGDILITKKQ